MLFLLHETQFCVSFARRKHIDVDDGSVLQFSVFFVAGERVVLIAFLLTTVTSRHSTLPTSFKILCVQVLCFFLCMS